LENHIFTGDTLFRGSIGRSDLIGGDSTALMDSLKNVLSLLPDQDIVHPGHNRETTIGEEKANNPWMRIAMSLS
ncbi:MAG TPA: MBL fold metallo-hydrolase, partial [Bacillota bacterium]|nr:MBL fold metallo-hydrolase [Bacillota bacterium]